MGAESLPIAVGAAAYNELSQQASERRQQRYNERNMKLQFSYAQQAERNSALNQVQGLRNAGLNPALLAGGSFSSGSASGPSGGMPSSSGQTLDPLTFAQLKLISAQQKNVEADTNKKNTEVGNIKADTENKFAQQLLYGSQTELNQSQKAKVDEEVSSIKSINEQYKDENQALAGLGKAMAEKWIEQPWFKAVSPDTQETIRSIADGTLPLSVGAMTALERVIMAQGNLSDADRKLVSNGFENAVTAMRFSDKAIMDAIAGAPLDQRNLLNKHIDEVTASIKKIGAEYQKLLQEHKNLLSQKSGIDLDNELKRMQNKAFKAGDLDYLKSQGEYGKWTEKFAENMLADMFRTAADLAKTKMVIGH